MSEPVKDRILQHCLHVFSTNGIKSVTMDDIASSMGISKKTIYSSFPDKKAIVDTIMNDVISRETEIFTRINKEAADAVHELILIMERTLTLYFESNPTALLDIRKYYPSTWETYLHYKENILLNLYQANLSRGMKEGVYHTMFHPYIMSRLWLEEVEVIRDRTVFPNYRFDQEELKKSLQYHFLFGLVTESGKKLLKKHLPV